MYVYESDNGVVVHVATRTCLEKSPYCDAFKKVISKEVTLEEAAEQIQLDLNWSKTCTMVDVENKWAGKTIGGDHETIADTLELMKSDGIVMPDDLIENIREEARELEIYYENQTKNQAHLSDPYEGLD